MPVEQKVWEQLPDGQIISLFVLENPFLRVTLTDQGASLVSLVCPDAAGNSCNVVVSGDAADVYVRNPSYLGATVGRFANRIKSGRFWLDGKEYLLAQNVGSNHLHGGIRGLTHRIWDATVGDDFVTFHTVSPDGEDGYPGQLEVTVTYRLTNHILTMDYSARSDATTVVNLTNHSYWNLAGSGSIADHQLELFADSYLEVDSDIVPTGTLLDVSGSPFDFRTQRRIGDTLPQTGNGYDHCFVVKNWDSSLRLAARVAEMNSGRIMEVHTTTPGVQFYTANHFDGSSDCGGFGRHEAFCLECQHFPDSPNQLEFPSTALRPGEEYRQTTEHRFFTVKR